MEAPSSLQTETKRLINIRPLTDNEKMLLVVLGIALVLFVGVSYILTPQAEKISELQADLNEARNRVEEINVLLARERDIRETRDSLAEEHKEMLERYFPVLDQPQIIYLLNDLVSKGSFQVPNFNFDKPASETVSSLEVRSMRVSVPFEGRYTDLLDVMESVQSSPKKVKIDSVTVDRVDDLNVGGSMTLRVYSLEGLVQAEPDVIDIPTFHNAGDVNPIRSFYGFEEVTQLVQKEEGDQGRIINNFESKNYDFIPSHSYVSGSASRTSWCKSGKYAARLEYSIVAVREENRAYLDISKQNIQIAYPPDNLSVWVYAFSYSPGNIGVRVMTQNGDVLHITGGNGVSWLGWNKVSMQLPGDISLYPLKVTHLYYEVPMDCDDFGVLVFDDLSVLHVRAATAQEAWREEPEYFFYKVEAGDTVSSISRKFYGTTRYSSEIMSNNGIASGEALRPGKILVLKKR